MGRVALAIGLAGALSLLILNVAAAQERTAVFVVSDVVIPRVDRMVSGQFTVSYDDASGAGTWAFQGMIDGQLATATGAGTFELTGSDEFRLTLTRLDSWNIPGVGGYVPRTAIVRTVGALAYVSYQGREVSLVGIPVAFSPKITMPVEGVYSVSSPGVGAAEVVTLPNTGEGPVIVPNPGRDSITILVGLATLLGAFAVATWRTRATKRTPATPI